jgi:hypothetical protein
MIAFSLVPLIIIAIIVIAIIVSAGKIQSKEGGDNVIKTVYNYLVLFATLMMVIGGGIGIFMSSADIVFPEPYYQTFDEYKNIQVPKPAPSETLNSPKLSDAELRTRYNEMIEDNKSRQVSRAKNTLFKSFGWVVIPLPVFLYFQRRISKKDEN